jgi:hypothetical protein
MSWIISKALMADCENSPYSPEPVEEYSEANSSDGGQSAPSNLSLTPQAFLSPDKMTAFSRLSRYGMTFAPLKEDLGAELLTSYLAAFPARTLAPLAKGQASKGGGLDSGGKWPESLARFDLDTSSWKTRQLLLFEDSGECLEIWPDWGITQGTECWAITPPAGVRKASASGLSLMRPIASDGLRHKFKLEHLIRKGHQDGNLSEQLARVHQVKLTPNAGEILMNWPQGWTDLKPLEMDKFRQWQDSHGKPSEGN